MTAAEIRNPLMAEITCGSLLQQLQEIWDEVGETEEDRDKMLLQLEKECLDVYKRNVDHAAKSKSCLIQALAQSRSELSNLLSVLGEEDITGVPDKTPGKIKEQLAAIAPVLDKLWKLKEERIKEFSNVQSQIQKIQAEIDGSELEKGPVIDEKDLSLTKLDEFHIQLEDLEKEKSDRLHEVHEYLSTVRDFCSVLGIDFLSTVTNVHPRLCDPIAKSISNDTLARLVKTVATLDEDKKQRLKKIQKLSAELIDLWNLLDTSVDERCLFDNVTHHISASADEISDAGGLALDLIEQVTAEVERLDQMKASRMKEIALKKQAEIEEILGRAHIEIDDAMVAHENIMSLIDSGKVEPSVLLADMDNHIRKAKEEAVSRKEILDKVEKWMSACEEESWLEDYNRDDNRYNGSRGAHLNLKRAEKARILVNKIPALVDILVAKTRAWEEDQDISFTYDGVPLLAMLEEYAMLRHDRAEERRRMRDHKKYHEQLNTEQETIFGSRPSPVRTINTKRVSGGRVNGGGGTPGRRLSLNVAQNGGGRSVGRDGRRGESCGGTRPVAPVNYVAISKEDTASHISCGDSFQASP